MLLGGVSLQSLCWNQPCALRNCSATSANADFPRPWAACPTGHIQHVIYYSVYIKHCYLEAILLLYRLRKWTTQQKYARTFHLNLTLLSLMPKCCRLLSKSWSKVPLPMSWQNLCLWDSAQSPACLRTTAAQMSAAGLVLSTSQRRFAGRSRKFQISQTRFVPGRVSWFTSANIS